ncbi:hypothetical protein C6P42_004402 [Pichia californica]|nr:hypothetical protein C6P42_004402 [[Candida] californica]
MSDDGKVPSLVFNMKEHGQRSQTITLNSVARTIDNNKWKDPKKWPKTLHDFISRSFKEAGQKKFNDNEVSQFKNQLKNIINMAIKSNNIIKNDWTKQKLPLLVPGSQTKLALYCDSSKNLKNSAERFADKYQENLNEIDNNNSQKRKNIFGEDESDSDSDSDNKIINNNQNNNQNISINYKDNLTKKPTIGLKDSLKKLKKQKIDNTVNNDINNNNNNNNNNLKTMSDKTKLQLRSKRFERELSEPISQNIVNNSHSDIISTKPIIGLNTTLEKKYLRLTSQPNPESVRPLKILKLTLQLLFDKYFEGAKYNYLCDQCKSMRQDLTVQNIKQDFSILAYEFHSKLAIENEDWGEFNQCQSQLKMLYDIKNLNMPNYLEFLSYRVLYYILTNNYNEIFELELTLFNKEFNKNDNIFLNYSLEIFKFIYNSDYYSLSKVVSEISLLNSSQELVIKELNLNKNLLITDNNALLLKHNNLYFFKKFLDVIMQRINIQTLSIICKSYRQISMNYIFEIMSMNNVNDLKKFLIDNHLDKFIINDDTFNCIGSRTTVENIRSKLFNKIDIKGQV